MSQFKAHRRGPITIRPSGFLPNETIAAIAAWSLHRKRIHGRRFKIGGDEAESHYLSRLHLHELLGERPVHRGEHPEAGRFIELHLVETSEDITTCRNAICRLVAHQVENSTSLLDALNWAVSEVLDNILEHAASPSPGVVAGQFYPSKEKLCVSIFDMGIGLRSSLASLLDTQSDDWDAIKLAKKKGVSGTPDAGRGNGLAGTEDILLKNSGRLVIWTGTAELEAGAGGERAGKMASHFGTGLLLQFNTALKAGSEDLLAQTWIQEDSFGFLEYEAEQVQKADGVLVREHSHSQDSRVNGAAVRRYLETVLAGSDEPIPLDFDGIQFANSSFLDEALGKLLSNLGPSRFRRRLRIRNASPWIKRQLSVVLKNREES